jgi:GDP-4-dehydro-6-deoxy-D-mannose reductase
MNSGRILVTGAGGFVGRHVVARAVERGLEPVGFEGDLREADVVRAQLQGVEPAAIVHLASRPRSAGALDDELAMARNLVGVAGDAVVLVAGSAAQYGMGAAEPLAEEAPTYPVTPYGEVKCAVERAALDASPHVIAARAFNIVGPGQGLDAPIASWAAQLTEGVETLRTGNLDVVRDFLDVRDAADAFLDLVGSGLTGVVNVGSGVPVTLRSVVDELIALTGRVVTVERDPALARPSDPPFVVADITRLQRATGFTPRIALRDSLAEVLLEWRERAQPGVR